MKRIISLLLILAMLLSLSACGKDKDGASDAAASPGADISRETDASNDDASNDGSPRDRKSVV